MSTHSPRTLTCLCFALTCGAVGVSTDCRLEAQYCHQQDVEMVPLMMEKGYRPTGWLGLILGTRLWYPFYGSAVETDAGFTQQMDTVVRDIGDRGKGVSEGVPPTASRAPAPAPAPARQAAPRTSAPATPAAQTAALRAAAPTPDRTFTPSIQASPQPAAVLPAGGTIAAGSFAELSTFMERQQALLMEQQKEARLEMETKLAQARADMDELRSEMTAEDRQAITDEQLLALQARLGALHTAKLLTDEQLFAAEDLCADFVELQATVPGGVLTQSMIHSTAVQSCGSAAKLHKLVVLSGKMACDAAFARQLGRKFL